MCTRRWWCGALLLAASVAQAQDLSLGLDLSPTAAIKAVLTIPPTTTVVVGKKGAFVGVDTRKSVEKFDVALHGKLVAGLNQALNGKALDSPTTISMLAKEGVTASTVDRPGVLAKLAKVANADWIVVYAVKNGSLSATIVDAAGKPQGQPLVFSGSTASAIGAAQAEAFGKTVHDKLLEVEKAHGTDTAPVEPVAAATPPPPPDEDLVDAELEASRRQAESGGSFQVNPSRVRALVAVGPGAALRGLDLSGDGAQSLAELENGAVVGLGVTAQILPLEIFDATAGKAWSQLSLEVHYRRAFVKAQGTGGGVEGQPCSMTDDDLQLRAGWRYRLGEGMLPTIGIAGGWSQEQTLFQCALPLVSTTWRGVDAQLRIRQPLYKDMLTLEVVGGPRFIFPGPLASSSAPSIAAEAWLELKPVSVVFARAGARFSRLTGASSTLSAIDTRTFIALEVGAFF